MGGAIGAIMGTCKHYCCGGNAACSALDPNWFCDIETVFHGINLVPVCTLIEPCVPFDTECPTTGDTCTLVNETTRQTACVTPGLAAVGDACAKEKCGANLACISGACKQLCKLMGTDGGVGQCPSGQTCVANSLFGAYAVGLCSDGPAP
jgi:hypothetical protein